MSEASGGLRSGLLLEGAPVPLEGVAVEAHIRAFAARVTLHQRYRNHEPHPIEAVYIFPLDEGAAVCGFEAQIGATRVVGRVEEREAAFRRYDDALAAGNGAYLLDQERPDVFSASIGNVPPGAEVTITLITVCELPLAGDDVRFVLPTTIAPRYAPVADRTAVGRAPADALNPPVALRVPYGLSVTVDVDLGVALRGVESPSHPLAVELDGTRARVTLGECAPALDRDFVLCVRPVEALRPQAWLEVEDGRGGVMLAFQPRFEAGAAPCEILFLIDRSGSMNGTSIAEARNALQLCLRSLTEQHFFNIISFGSRHTLLFPHSRRYDASSLAEASAHVAALEADMGGTEILGALEAAFATPACPDAPRQVFVLTDGQVTNTADVIRCVRRHCDRVRVFTFGIGAGASAHLVRGMARAGEGTAEFIAPGERMEGKVLRQLERALAPAAVDVQVDWGGLGVVQAPHRIPPVFAGGRLIVYGLLEGAPRATRVRLRGRTPAGPFDVPLDVDPAAAHHERIVVTLAARAAIRDLEEGMSSLHDRRGSLQERGGGGDARVKTEIVRLGTTYGLVSSATSFVAVEERATPLHADMQLRRVPVALTRGWGAVEDTLLGGAKWGSGPGARPAPPRAVLAELALHRPAKAALTPPSYIADLEPAAFEVECDLSTAPMPSQVHESSAAPPAVRPLDRLVALQCADGSWELTEELAELLGLTLAVLETHLPGASGDAALARRAWATALALSWLERHACDCRDEWRLLARKAQTWLGRCPARPQAGDWSSSAVQLKL